MEPPVLMRAVPVRVFGREVERSGRLLLACVGLLLAWVVTMSVAISAFELLPPPPDPRPATREAAPVHWTFWHACYFTVTNVTTVGLGDAAPRTHAGKVIAGANSVAGLLFFGMIAAAFVRALSPVEYSGVGGADGEPARLAGPREPIGNDDALALALSGLGFILRESALADAARPRGEPLAEWRERSFAYVISDRQEIEIIVRSR
jgi:hypothetical protein